MSAAKLKSTIQEKNKILINWKYILKIFDDSMWYGAFWHTLLFSRKYQLKSYLTLACWIPFAYSNHVSKTRNYFPVPKWSVSEVLHIALETSSQTRKNTIFSVKENYTTITTRLRNLIGILVSVVFLKNYTHDELPYLFFFYFVFTFF